MDDFFLTRHEIKCTERTCKGLCVLAVASLVACDSLQKEVLVVLRGSVHFSCWRCGCRVPAKGGKHVFPVSCSRIIPAASRQSAGAMQKDTLHCIAYWYRCSQNQGGSHQIKHRSSSFLHPTSWRYAHPQCGNSLEKYSMWLVYLSASV